MVLVGILPFPVGEWRVENETLVKLTEKRLTKLHTQDKCKHIWVTERSHSKQNNQNVSPGITEEALASSCLSQL
jgi:hypothetical protein